MTSGGRYRWRTRVRGNAPWRVSGWRLFAKGPRDCGAHEWYNHDGAVALCYHCAVGVRPWNPARPGGETR